MSCPECGSNTMNMLKQDTDGMDFQCEQYECEDCGCCWEWRMTRVITTHGSTSIFSAGEETPEDEDGVKVKKTKNKKRRKD